MPNTAEAAAFLPAIEALRLELFRIEQEASDVRALLERLCAHAGIAGEQATVPGEAAMAPKAKGTRGQLQSAGPGRGKKGKTGGTLLKPPVSDAPTLAELGVSSGGAKSKPPEVDAPTLAELGVSKRQAEAVSGGGKGRKPKPLVKLADLGITEAQSKDDQASAQKIVAVISEASAEVQSAMRANDANKLSAAISARATAERVAGKLLVALAGKRPLPPGISKAQSKKYRRVAGLSAGEWAAALRRSQNRALRRIGAPAAALDSISAAPARPERAKDRPAHAAPPKPAMKLSDWTREADGVMSRTLTGEDARLET